MKGHDSNPLYSSISSLRRGAVAIYSIIAMVALIGIASLAVDLARVQIVKTEQQNCADATARGYMQYYKQYGQTYANTNGPLLYTNAYNSINSDAAGAAATVSVTWGSWDTTTKAFSTSAGTNKAVKVTVNRTAAGGNGVKLFWGSVIGRSYCDVKSTAIATVIGGQSSSVSVAGTANPYLAGMPSNTTNQWYDDYTNAAPFEVSTIPVIPGTWISFTSVTGTANILPGYVANSGPQGLTNIPVHHGQNFDYSINNPGPENGIADAVMPEGAFMGLFLNDNQSDSTAAPATVDWTVTGVADQPTYSNIQLKQPFYVGDGKTSGGTTQMYQVPPGATRLFIGIWDGVGYYNNTGSMAATINVQQTVSLVQ